MTDAERNAVEELMQTAFVVQDEFKTNAIKDEFIRTFTIDVTKNPDYVIQLLEAAYIEENPDDVEYALIICGNFGLVSEQYVDILLKLMESDWHFNHENIVESFQELKSSAAIECLYRTALRKFEYLAYDEALALSVKCIWALGEINTDESRERLNDIYKSKNKILKRNALYQLQRH